RAARLERAIEIDLADLATERRLRELDDRELVARDAVRRLAGVQDLQIENAVDPDLHVVLGDADLLRDIDRVFLEAVLVGDALDEGQEDVNPRLQRAAVFAEIFDDVRALLRHDGGGLRDDDDDQNRDDQDDG